MDQIARVNDIYNGEKVTAVLCHYPILEWWHKHHGVWHIYGHIHTDTGETFEIISSFDRALNAGAAINNYMPVSFKELVDNNRAFQEKVRHHGYKNDRYNHESGDE